MAAIKLKHIQLPDSMKRAMARQAEAEGGSMAAAALGAASGIMMARPLALQLRTCRAWSRWARTRTSPWCSRPRS
jgi:hypothetical protein